MTSHLGTLNRTTSQFLQRINFKEKERERDHKWTSVNTCLNNNQESNLLRQSGILNSDYLTALKHQGFS